VSGIVDGRAWRAERRRRLRAELEKDLTDDQRQPVEAELAALEQEIKSHRRPLWRWLVWGGRKPGL
jgi:hypothetical protein